MLVLYHYTSAENAEQILREGFRDGEGYYLTEQLWRGVWLSDTPLDGNETGRIYRQEAWAALVRASFTSVRNEADRVG
jgi:hypothetical protein